MGGGGCPSVSLCAKFCQIEVVISVKASIDPRYHWPSYKCADLFVKSEQ